MINDNTLWIVGISRGHNSGVCLLKDGEIIFNIEEERLSRRKYDGSPFAGIYKILEYTERVDYVVISYTVGLKTSETTNIEFTGGDIYTGILKKLGLINRDINSHDHPQIIDCGNFHHKIHASGAFYKSGFDTATTIIIDGAGSSIVSDDHGHQVIAYEVESIFECSKSSGIRTKYKHFGSNNNIATRNFSQFNNGSTHEPPYDVVISDRAGIVKTYEAVTAYCGFHPIEAGKTMGLFPYGNPNDKIPQLFNHTSADILSNRNLIIPSYPAGGAINAEICDELNTFTNKDVTLLQNRRDLAYACQKETQEQVVNLIRKAINITGNKNIVISGGYGLNCVSNYYYLDALKDEGINLYVDPLANDGGTALGAALYFYTSITNNRGKIIIPSTLYLGPEYNYTIDYIKKSVGEVGGVIETCDHNKIIDLLLAKNVVALFQGRSENGPRALGNRSLLFDPRIPNGKDIVNGIKNREYFRPFAGTILEEDVHDWFDLRGMESSPFMMYAVNCKPGIEEKIPAIIHVDGTCRIQTVNRDQNVHFYDLINLFKERTECPILFNTSFNLAGEPLVETIEDAIRTLKNSKIEYMYLPELKLLVNIKN